MARIIEVRGRRVWDSRGRPTVEAEVIVGRGTTPLASGRAIAPAGASTGSGEAKSVDRSEEHTSELQSLAYLVCRLLLEKKKKQIASSTPALTITPSTLKCSSLVWCV